jgi:hypothetical protein
VIRARPRTDELWATELDAHAEKEAAEAGQEISEGGKRQLAHEKMATELEAWRVKCTEELGCECVVWEVEERKESEGGEDSVLLCATDAWLSKPVPPTLGELQLLHRIVMPSAVLDQEDELTAGWRSEDCYRTSSMCHAQLHVLEFALSQVKKVRDPKALLVTALAITRAFGPSDVWLSGYGMEGIEQTLLSAMGRMWLRVLKASDTDLGIDFTTRAGLLHMLEQRKTNFSKTKCDHRRGTDSGLRFQFRAAGVQRRAGQKKNPNVAMVNGGGAMASGSGGAKGGGGAMASGSGGRSQRAERRAAIPSSTPAPKQRRQQTSTGGSKGKKRRCSARSAPKLSPARSAAKKRGGAMTATAVDVLSKATKTNKGKKNKGSSSSSSTASPTSSANWTSAPMAVVVPVANMFATDSLALAALARVSKAWHEGVCTMERYGLIRPAVPAAMPASATAARLQLQLSVVCDFVSPGGFSAMSKESIKYYRNSDRCFRDLIVSASTSGFDLLRAVLCAFGLSTAFTPARGGALEIDKDVGAVLYDTLPVPGDPTAEHRVRMSGVRYKSKLGNVGVVGTGELRRLKAGQLLDSPVASSSTRSRGTGGRQTVRVNAVWRSDV